MCPDSPPEPLTARPTQYVVSTRYELCVFVVYSGGDNADRHSFPATIANGMRRSTVPVSQAQSRPSLLAINLLTQALLPLLGGESSKGT